MGSRSSDRLLLKDDFAVSLKRGYVIGSKACGEVHRLGIDSENVFSIDNGALRIQPLLKPAWGRSCISYGPFTAAPGLALGVFMLNGHNTSQSGVMSDSLKSRLERWMRGSGCSPVFRRMLKWLASGRVKRVARQVMWWRRIATGSGKIETLNENLAIGFFPTEVSNPNDSGTCFIMHAAGPDNGELRVRSGNGFVPVARGVQNLQILYVLILREGDTIYYATSVAAAMGMGSYPNLRPISIGHAREEGEVYTSIHQSVLGQIGFRADSRVYGVRVSVIGEYGSWCGGAHAADRFQPTDRFEGRIAEIGGSWVVRSGQTEGMDQKTTGQGSHPIAILTPGEPSGLIRAKFRWDDGSVSSGLIWRYQDPLNYWQLQIREHGCELGCFDGGNWIPIRNSEEIPAPGSERDAQIQDDGRHVSAYLDGALLFGGWIEDSRHSTALGTGIDLMEKADTAAFISLFEAHPRELPVPGILDLGPPWFREGTKVELEDDFSGDAAELDGQPLPKGNKTWRLLFGNGVFELTGKSSVKVRATPERPCPGRTIYALDWDYPEFADMEVSLTPPGSARGEKAHGTSGFALWQDEDNYLLVNIWLDDKFGGASISSFFSINGFEDIYDAVWSNVGSRIRWGHTSRLRLVCDGMNYAVSIDGEPVLYRALTDVYPDCKPLRIHRVGLQANWEWGTDTGSRFENFVARR